MELLKGTWSEKDSINQNKKEHMDKLNCQSCCTGALTKSLYSTQSLSTKRTAAHPTTADIGR